MKACDFDKATNAIFWFFVLLICCVGSCLFGVGVFVGWLIWG